MGGNKIKFLFHLLLISIPISGIGYSFGDAFISLSIIPYLLFSIFSYRLISTKAIPLVGLLSFLFIFVCLYSNLFRNPLSSFLLPLILLIFLCSIFLSRISHRIDTWHLLSALRLSYITVLITVLLEVLFYIAFGLNPPVYSAFSLHGSSIEYYGIPRLRGFQLEPSILSYVALFYYVSFNRLTQIVHVPAFFTTTPILILLSTMSAVGIIFLIYLVLNFIFDGTFVRYVRKYPFSTFFMVILFTIGGALSWVQLYKVFEKIFDVYRVIQDKNLLGSVGYRVHSLFEPFYFFSSGDLFDNLFGTGFSNYSSYILKKYNHLEYSGFASGDLNSILSAVAISTGVVGLISFVMFVYFGFRDRSIQIFSDRCFLFVIFLILTYGNLTAPFIWVMFITLYLLRKTNSHDTNLDRYN